MVCFILDKNVTLKTTTYADIEIFTQWLLIIYVRSMNLQYRYAVDLQENVHGSMSVLPIHENREEKKHQCAWHIHSKV